MVIDASVAAAAFLTEELAPLAIRALSAEHELYAPGLIFTEFGNVLWKRLNHGEILVHEAFAIMDSFLRIPFRITSSMDLVRSSLELAVRTRRTVYDCAYLALAIRTRSRMVTADKRLANALSGTPLAKHIIWLGDT
jgi:predicted nucleic acid-binding protein